MNKEIDNSNFDQLFQEKLAEHGTTPPADMWDKVNSDFLESSSNFDESIRSSLSNHEASPSMYLRMKVLLNPSLLSGGAWLKLGVTAAVLTTIGISLLEKEEPKYSVRSESYINESYPLEFSSEDDFLFRKNLIIIDPINKEKPQLSKVERLPVYEIKNNTKELPDNSITTTTIVKTITTTTTVVTTTIVGADTSSERSTFQEEESIIEEEILPLKQFHMKEE